MRIERRVTAELDDVQLRYGKRDGEAEQPVRVVGHAAVFDRLSEPIGGLFRERIAPGAFRRALEERQDVRALIDHDPGRVLGRTASGTLRMAQDGRGLAVEIDLPDTSYARDLAEVMARGDVDQMSFGFMVRDDELLDRESADGLPIREVRDVDLFDVSVVTFPAYPDTDAAVREFRSRYGSGRKGRSVAEARQRLRLSQSA